MCAITNGFANTQAKVSCDGDYIRALGRPQLGILPDIS